MTARLPDEERANTRGALRFLVERSEPAELAEALGVTAVALLENALPRADAT